MKFRIIRDYDEYQPQVWHETSKVWCDIGKYICRTLEDARKVCADFKQMRESSVVEEFEL